MKKRVPEQLIVVCDFCGETADISRGEVGELTLDTRDVYEGGKVQYDMCGNCIASLRSYINSQLYSARSDPK
jgi:hypothetical protein